MPVNAGAPAEDGNPIRFAPLEKMPARFNYWHVELEEHECIVANGVPAESIIDYVGRSGFDNYGEYLDLVGADRLIPEMPLPRISARRLLPANRSDDADALIRLARLRLSTPRPAALRRRNRISRIDFSASRNASRSPPRRLSPGGRRPRQAPPRAAA